jgi:hypothetical protein
MDNRENDASKNSSIIACVFIAAIMFLVRGIYTHTDSMVIA